MRRRWAGLWGATILACLSGPALAAPGLTAALDLQAEAAQAAARGGPLIVIYSRADCSFCQTVKRDYLLPLQADPVRGKQVVVREIGQDTEAPLRDFQGRLTTHARFAKAEKVRLVPVVAFYGNGGRMLADPIVGARLPDFYQGYLDEAIVRATRQLKTP